MTRFACSNCREGKTEEGGGRKRVKQESVFEGKFEKSEEINGGGLRKVKKKQRNERDCFGGGSLEKVKKKRRNARGLFSGGSLGKLKTKRRNERELFLGNTLEKVKREEKNEGGLFLRSSLRKVKKKRRKQNIDSEVSLSLRMQVLGEENGFDRIRKNYKILLVMKQHRNEENKS